MYKKGNAIIDTALILAIVFTLVLAVFIINSIVSPINLAIQNSSDYGEVSKNISSQTSSNYGNFWDSAIPLLLVAFWVSALVSSFMVDSNPIFFVFSIIGLIVILMIAYSLNAVYVQTLEDTSYAGYEVSFPMINWIMSHIALVMIVISSSIMVVLYGKG